LFQNKRRKKTFVCDSSLKWQHAKLAGSRINHK
jgi:hypothetical protein